MKGWIWGDGGMVGLGEEHRGRERKEKGDAHLANVN